MNDFAEFATRVKWNDLPKPLTEENYLAYMQPRHANCDCPLFQMDKRVIESTREYLFGKKE